MSQEFLESIIYFNELMLESDEDLRRRERLAKDDPIAKQRLERDKLRMGERPKPSAFGGLRRNRSQDDLQNAHRIAWSRANRLSNITDPPGGPSMPEGPRRNKIQSIKYRTILRAHELGSRDRALDDPSKQTKKHLTTNTRNRKLYRSIRQLSKRGFDKESPEASRVWHTLSRSVGLGTPDRKRQVAVARLKARNERL